MTSIFIILIGAISTIGVLETFKNELVVYWPELEFYLEYVYETLKNIIVLNGDSLSVPFIKKRILNLIFFNK